MKATSFTIPKVLKKLYPLLILFCLKLSPVQAQCTEEELATSYVSNNSNKGVMFDIVTGANTVTITSFDFNLILGSTGVYEIYYKSGTSLGSENNAALWTLAGTSSVTPCIGYDYPSPILLALSITIPANSTYGFYVTNNNVASTAGIRYTNNSANATLIASDANISIISGRGKAYPFLTNYDNRSVNCTPHYYVGSPPTAPTSISVSETSVCSGSDVSLAASCATGTVKWYNQASGGTSIGTGTGLIQNPTSNTTYYAVCENGTCESSRIATSQVIVTTQPGNPTGVSVNQTNVCSGSSVSLTATCATGTITWYNQATGGSAIGTGSPLSQSPTVNTTYHGSCKNGTCESSRGATSQVIVTNQPNNPTGVNVSQTNVCSGSSVSLTATCATGTITWYNQATGGSAIGTGSPLSQSPTVNTTYYASCKNGTCESSRVATSQVTVSAASFIVSNLNDSGTGSFRQAITDANSSSCGSIIDATGVTGTINLLSILPNINANITINGPTTGNLILKRNSADNFRILSISSGKTVTINDLIITNGNDTQGAGINNMGNLTLNRLIITGNTSVQGSGIQSDNILVMNNCLLANNGSNSFESYGTTNIFNNCTISGYVSLSGSNATLTLKNSYLQSMPDDRKLNSASGNYFFENSFSPLPPPVGSFINEKAQFINPDDVDGADNIYRTADDGYNLLSCSPMINAGNNSGVTGTDIAGNTRIFNTTVDIGAYEYQSTTFISLVKAESPYVNAETEICYFNSSDLTASCQAGQVEWYNGNTLLSTGTSFNLQSQLPIPSTYFIDIYCSLSDPSCQSSKQNVPVFLPRSPSNVRTEKPVYCAGENIVLQASCGVSSTVRWYNQASGGSILGTGGSLTITGASASATYYANCLVLNCESVRIPISVKVGTPTRKYVKYNATGNNDGSSWANAYTTLQPALDASCNGTEIWVAKGTYYPTTKLIDTTDNRFKTFSYTANLQIYGGFAGINETSLAERDIDANPTILSGDFNNDDIISGEGSTLSITNKNENAYHVLLVVANPIAGVIDGFTIKGGNADSSVNYLGGGGLLFTNSVYPAEGEYGIKLNNIIFTGNNSKYAGGGMSNLGIAQVTHSKFIKNIALSGGGFDNKSGADISDVVFEGNRASYKGGGLSVDSGQVTLNRAYFKNNYAQHLGGGYAHEGGIGSVDNVVFTGNSARYGGAIFNTFGIGNITNSTIAKNTAINGGGLVYSNSSTVNLKNSIIWGNTGSNSVNNLGYFEHPIVSFYVGTPTLNQTNSLIQGFGSANGNIDANPQFRNENDADGADNTLFTIDDGFNLTKCSPAINAGTNTGVQATDILNNPRPYIGGNVDIGAFEYSVMPAATNILASQTAICNTTTISLSASCAVGTVTWYNQATGGSAIGTGSPLSRSVSATSIFYASCKDACDESSRTATQQIIYESITAPIVTAPNPKVVCAPSTLTLTASGCAGTVTWSTGSSGTSLTLSSVGTYSITAICTAGSCISPTSTAVTGLQIVTPPSAPTITAPNQKVVCSPSTLTLTASGCVGTVTWSTGSSGTSLTLSSVGTYSISATCAVGSCISNASTAVTGLQIVTQPSAPTVTAPNQKVVCAPSTLTLTASGCAGTVTWSTGSSGTSLMLSSVGTYSITATCTVGSCTSVASSAVTGLQIVAPPTVTITGNINLSCNTTSVTRTANGIGASLSYQWSNSLGTNATANITSSGTYTVTVTETNGCAATATTSVTQNIVTPTASITGSTNLTCATTSVTRTASGGGTYQWSNNLGTNAMATITSPGTYTVTITGANGCTATATTSVTQNIVTPTASITGSTNLTCAITSVTRTASGGGTYQWSNGLGTNSTANITSAGTYTVTVTGVNGCTATATTNVTQDGSLPTASITGTTNLSCTTTSVTRTASGGGTYLWSNSLGTNATATITNPGIYTVTVTGANGCTATATTSVTQDIVTPTASIIGSANLTCATTSVTRTASGGGTYQWSNSLGTNAIASITNPGIYTVTVTGANGCTATATTIVTQSSTPPSASITGSTNLSCTTTTVTRTAGGGGTYLWSGGLGTNAIANITSPGTYTVTVTAANGCTTTATTAVTQDASVPNASITGSTNLSCATTSVTRTASGGGSGTPPAYQWSNGLGTNATATITSAGTYTVTVTGANGCTATATTTVIQDASVPSASITGTTNLTCTTTSVTRTASGGSTYLWSNSLGTNATANITSPGTYTVTVTAANGCTATATTSVTQDGSLPTASITGSTNLTCATTTVTRTASGGGTYQWSNSLGTNATANITSSGTYTVTITGANGCTATATTSVTQNIVTPTASITGSTNLTCAITSVTRTASGGGTYLWSNGLGTNATATITSAGTYTVTVTGTNGCTATATTSVTQNIVTPTASITGSTNLTCAITSVTRTASGGGTYLWSNSLGTNATATITNPGIYTVTVTGANGCTATATPSVTRDIVTPTASIIGSANLTCATTSVTRTASGGGTYQWSNSLGTNAIANITSPGTYTVTVTGANGCTATATTTVIQDASVPSASITGTTTLTCTTTSVTRTASGGSTYLWSNSLGTNAIANITSPGTYTITVTGANGCTATATTSVTQSTTPPSASITGSTNLTCATTSVTRTASGGGTYLWSNSLGANATATITSPGTYTVTVTGANGCIATATTNVTQDGSLPTASIIGSANLTCATTSVTRTASGGGTYQWSNSLGTNATATIISPGTYTVTVTGANGCIATVTTSVTQSTTPPSASITGTTNLSCTTTSVTRTASGGGTYLWSNSLGTNATANITSPGTYTVTVTGANGCTATATTLVTQDASVPSASITGTTNLTCTTTSVTRTASGGSTYLWSNSLGTNAIANITNPGIYTVTVTGANGCTATATTSVTQDIVTPTASITGTTNLTCATTSVTRTASGGGTYLWSNSLGTNATATITSPGTYTVTVTGINGCTATATTAVTQDGSLPTASITGSTNLTCATTSVTRTASGGGSGTPPAYQWSNGLGTNATATITSPGTYTVTVTGANGCTATATTSVTQSSTPPSASITGSTNLTCATTSVTRTASGGGTYLWSNSLGTNATATITSPGTYTVTVTGANGCTATATTSVTQDIVTPTASITGSTNLTCATTSVTRTASGGGSGTPPAYQWSNSLGTNAIANITSPGTYTVTVTGANSCTATATTSVTQNLLLTASASNTGPYSVGQTIQLNASDNSSGTPPAYSWAGPASFTSSSQSPAIPDALLTNSGIYTLTVVSGICTTTATTNVIVSGIDPCTQIVDLQYVKSGNPYQSMFSLTDGMVIQQIPEQVSIIANPICPNISIGSVDLTITGPEINWTILQNVQPYAVFDNLALNVYGRNFLPGTYTMTVTGYAEDNRAGGTVYGPVVTTFTVVGTMAVINAPTIPNNRLCAGSTVDVTFATTGSFDSSNLFKIQLSDSTGGFTNPILIGTATTAGTISCQLPQNLSATGQYLIRVASSNQVVASNPTMQYLSIIPAMKNLTANISTGMVTEQASLQINAASKITSPANVTYNAGKAIVLNPGFESREGSVFKAQIQGCNN